MRKDMKKLLDHYIIADKEERTLKKDLRDAFNFGYYDGYFAEEMYLQFISNKEVFPNYMKGYKEAINELKETEYETVLKEKDGWLKKLAAWDGITNFDNRVFSKDTKKVYDKYRTLEFSKKEIGLNFDTNKQR